MGSKYCPLCGKIVEITLGVGGCICGWAADAKYALAEPLLRSVPMPYLSIDLETTGLDAKTCQILEIGAVYDDWTKPIGELPIFHRYVCHDTYIGNAYALALNSNILRRLSAATINPPFEDGIYTTPDLVASSMARWLKTGCGWDGQRKLTPAGKNYATFDRDFLNRLPGFEAQVRLKHRVLDPAPLFWRPFEDEELPDSKTCMERAGIDGKVAHTAVEDALAVVRMIRYAVSQK